MALDEELDEQEMRVLLMNKAVLVANAIGERNENGFLMKRDKAIEVTRRMAQLAESLPPELKQ